MSQHRTPLRYPGGKQRLVPFIRELLEVNNLVGGHYVEPYAGGAGVAFDLLLDGVVSQIHLNDVSIPVYAFWNSVISQTDELCALITRASLTVDEWDRRRAIVQNPEGQEELEIGFSTLYLNRCNRSGVLAGGLIGGRAQNGKWNMDARFNRSELIRRIQAIASRRTAITLHRTDAEVFISTYLATLPANTLVYCDPPYFNLSSRLYLSRYKNEDHIRVAGVIQDRLQRKWIVSYDDTPEIQNCYRNRRHFSYYLQYNADRSYKGREIFIFSDDMIIPDRSSLPYIDAALQTAVIAREGVGERL